jgi:hypothetical protein
LLARRSEVGYTHSAAQALHGEPEAVSEAAQREISTTARTRFAEQRQEQLAREDCRRWTDRWKKVEQRARDRNVDIYKFVIQFRRNVLAAEEAVERTP